MTTLASEIKVSIQWLFQEPLALTTVGDASQLAYDDALASGTAADEADRIWSDQRTLAAGANDDLDLTALTHSLFGSTVTIDFARVKAILIVHTSTTSGEKLSLDSSVTNGFTGPFAGSATSQLEIGADSAAIGQQEGRLGHGLGQQGFAHPQRRLGFGGLQHRGPRHECVIH